MLSVRFVIKLGTLITKSPNQYYPSTEPEPHQILIHSAKYIPGKNIFCSIKKEKIRGEWVFEIANCLFDIHH